MIHPTAIVNPGARIAADACIGPHAVIDGHVVLGAGCWVGPNVHLTGHTTIGANNRFHTGAVIGDAPQDLKYKDEPTRVLIGDNNIFREHVTVHRSNKLSDETILGSNNFLMANSHVGHNSRLGNQVILANGALLGGHVVVEDRAFISGNCLVHQFVRIGTLALMQGGSAVSKDVPPYTVAHAVNCLCGLNTIGLRRAGMASAERLELKRVYHLLFRSGLKMSSAMEQAKAEFHSAPARTLLDFVAGSKRGVCADVKSASAAMASD
jgi:UDP-N-acetylglucosamine acyltransferase